MLTHSKHTGAVLCLSKCNLLQSVSAIILFSSASPTFADACVAAGEAVPLLAVSIQPDAEDHEDDPAGSADARDEGRLLDHIRDLLRQGVLLANGLSHTAGGICGWDWSRRESRIRGD